MVLVSLTRLYKLISSTSLTHTKDTNILFMALHVLQDSDSQMPELYPAVKHGVDECFTSGQLTLNVLAAEVLIAAFEIGQAIYPAAYLSTVRCARLAHLVGIHDSRRAVQVLPNPG